MSTSNNGDDRNDDSNNDIDNNGGDKKKTNQLDNSCGKATAREMAGIYGDGQTGVD